MLFRQGYYWSTILKDCINYAKSCEECQKHGPIQQVPASELHLGIVKFVLVFINKLIESKSLFQNLVIGLLYLHWQSSLYKKVIHQIQNYGLYDVSFLQYLPHFSKFSLAINY